MRAAHQESPKLAVVLTGYSCVGKTATAGALQEYGFARYNTGQAFRTTAAGLLMGRIDFRDLSDAIREARIEVDASEPGKVRAAFDGRDVSGLLYHPSVSRLAVRIGSDNEAAPILESGFYASLIGSLVVVEGKGHIVAGLRGYETRSFILKATESVRADRKFELQNKVDKNYTQARALDDIRAGDTEDRELVVITGEETEIDTSHCTARQVASLIMSHILGAGSEMPHV